MIDLERRLGRVALVRYAAPAIRSAEDLFRAQVNGNVLNQTNFVAPHRIGAPHNVWTFVEPGNRGYANPDGQEIEHDATSDIAKAIAAPRSDQKSLLSHLQEIKDMIGELIAERHDPAYFSALLDGRLADDRAVGLANLFDIGTYLGLLGASWWIASDRPDKVAR